MQDAASDTYTYEGTLGCFLFGFWQRLACIASCFPLALSTRLSPPKVPRVEEDHYVKSRIHSCGTPALTAVLHNIPFHYYLSPFCSYQENGMGASCALVLQKVNLTEVYLDAMGNCMVLCGNIV